MLKKLQNSLYCSSEAKAAFGMIYADTVLTCRYIHLYAMMLILSMDEYFCSTLFTSVVSTKTSSKNSIWELWEYAIFPLFLRCFSWFFVPNINQRFKNTCTNTNITACTAARTIPSKENLFQTNIAKISEAKKNVRALLNFFRAGSPYGDLNA